MKTNVKKSFLAGTPSWVLALLTLFGATIVLFGIAEGLGPYIKINEVTGEAILYSLNGIIIAVCCYFIVKRNPKSIWYVLPICNAVTIIPAIVEPIFWITKSMWIPMCGGLVLSIITSIIGARVGKRKAISDKLLTKLAGIPSWALAVLTLFGATIVMKLIGEGLLFLKINENIADAISFSLFGIIIAVCCYFMVKKNPKSIWYVVLICNVFVIGAAFVPDFWISTSSWIPMCGGLVLSIIASIIGARKGRKVAVSENP